MYIESRKLHIIEAVLRTEDEAMLKAMETIVDQENAIGTKTKGRHSDLLGTLTHDEADSMKKTIEDHFEIINPGDEKIVG